MGLVVNNIQISQLATNDAQAIYECMMDPDIAANTMRIPYPYTLQNAVTWLEDNVIFEEENGMQKNFAIRNGEAKLIGSIGLHFNYGLDADKSGFGYWLDKNYRNQGIMTEAIKQFCCIARNHSFRSLEAYVFDYNISSQKVLLKAGFTYTEKRKAYYVKQGKKIDAMKYVKRL